MHASIIWLTLFALALIGLMITCFVYFIRSRRKEDEEFMQQVQFTQRQQQQHNNYLNSTDCQQQQQLASGQSPSSQQQGEQLIVMNNSANSANSAHQRRRQHQHQQQQSCEMVGGPAGDELAAYQLAYAQPPAPPDASPNIVSNSYAAAYAAAAASPYHNQAALGQQSAGPAARNEVRSDITQQINSAIIGSADAEFQNDFIQVFPMYQIAPQPEKNTTPYLT